MEPYIDYNEFVAKMEEYERASYTTAFLIKGQPAVIHARVIAVLPVEVTDKLFKDFDTKLSMKDGKTTSKDDGPSLVITLMDSDGKEINATAEGTLAKKLEGFLQEGNVYEFRNVWPVDVDSFRLSRLKADFDLKLQEIPICIKPKFNFPDIKWDSTRFDYKDVAPGTINSIIGVLVSTNIPANYAEIGRNSYFLKIINPFGDIVKINLAHSFQAKRFVRNKQQAKAWPLFRTVVAVRGVDKSTESCKTHKAWPIHAEFKVFDDTLFAINPLCEQHIILRRWMNNQDEKDRASNIKKE